MRLTLLVVFIFISLRRGDGFFNSLMDTFRRLTVSNSTHWLMDQPEHHHLSKGLPGAFNLLEIQHPKIVHLQRTNFSLLGSFRDYDCGGDRNSFTVLDPGSAQIIKYSCNQSEYISRDCLRCEAGKRNQLIHPSLVYDDAICQADYSQDWINVPHDTEICQIDNLKIRDCNQKKPKMEVVNWIWKDGDIRIVENFQVIWREGEYLTLFDCRNLTGTSCDKEVCRLGKCSGDSSFCSNFMCEKTSPMCICKRNEVPGVAVFRFKGLEVIPLCFGRSKWLVQREVVKREATSESTCVDCSFECKTSSIMVIVRHFKPGFYKACLGPTCITGLASGSEFRIPFKMADRITSKSINLKIWDTDRSSSYKLDGQCSSVEECEVIDCWFCWANWANIHCFSKEQTLLIVLIGGLCLFLIATTIRALKTIVTFTWILLKPVIKLLILLWKLAKYLMKKKSDNVKQKIKDIELGMQEAEVTPIVSGERTSSAVSKHRKIMNLLSISILMLSCQPSLSCTDLISVTAESRTCVNPGGGNGSCYFTSNSLLQVSPRGQESCLALHNSAGDLIEILKIKTEDIQLECDKSDLYWVPRLTHKCLGTRRCHLMGECKGEYCANFKLTDYSSEWGDKQNLMNSLGWSYCSEQCGGALCQCFNLNPSCFFYRKTFQPLGPEVYNIFECSQWTYKLQVSIITNSSIEKAILKLGVPHQIKNGLLSIESISQPPEIGFNRCFGETESGDKFHATCNKRQEYTTGRLGEVQCPTKIDAQRISSHCLSSESIISAKVHLDDINCFSSLIDPADLHKRNRLPATIGGLTFHPTTKSVEAIVSEAASASILVKLINFKVDFRVDQAKCSVRFVSLHGCYNCEQGAELIVNAVSNFGSVLALMSCPSLDYSSYLNVDSNLKEISKVLHVNKSHISDDCQIICPNSRSVLKISGELIYLFNEDLRHTNQTVTPSLKPKLGFGWDPFGWLKAGWMRIVWAILGGTLSFIIALILAFVCLKLLCKAKKL